MIVNMYDLQRFHFHYSKSNKPNQLILSHINCFKPMSSQHEEPTEQNSPPKQRKHKRETNRKKKAFISQVEENVPAKSNKEKQSLLTNFCKKRNANSSHQASTNSSEFLPNNRAIHLLQQQLKKKDSMIERLQNEAKNQHQKSVKLRQEYLCFNHKTKQSIVQSKRQLAAMLRKSKGEIIPKYGYFKDQAGSFVQGEYLSEIRLKIQNLSTAILDLQLVKSSSKKQSNDNLNTPKITFFKKQVAQLKQELSVREREVVNYKQQLRLTNYQRDCIFAKEKWPLLKNRYLPLSLIGSGGFGEVYKGFDAEKYQQIAIKIHSDSKTTAQNYQAYIRYLNRQIKIHKQLQHPNIVKMIDQLQLQGNRVGFIMEYCSGPELRAYMKKEGCLDERQAKFIIKQLIHAIKYLHEQKYKVVHYDLKPANILFHNGVIKIVDFGISKIIENEDSRIDLTSPGIGTYYYLPPEVFEESNAKISTKVDIWSIGVIFFQMLYAKKPFGNGLPQSKILSGGIILQAYNVTFPSSSPKNYRISEQAKKFIRSCLQHNPEKRLSPLEAYEHDYIN